MIDLLSFDEKPLGEVPAGMKKPCGSRADEVRLLTSMEAEKFLDPSTLGQPTGSYSY
jgi:hypothetical protein